MKKTLVALAALAAATGAFAQSPLARTIDASGVTIFGVADVTATRLSSDNAGSRLSLQGDGRNESTRLGFRGVEDMGGGWGAAFWIEAAYNQDDGTGSNSTATNNNSGDKLLLNSSTLTTYNNTGAGTTVANAQGGSTSASVAAPNVGGPTTINNASLYARQGLTFNRAATVSLINRDVGEIRLGRDYSAGFWNWTGFDPFGTVGVGSALQTISGSLAVGGGVANPPGAPVPHVRASNSISWLSNNMNGFRAQLQTSLSEVYNGCSVSQSDVYGNYCAGTSGDGKLLSARLRYTSGPLDGAVSYTSIAYNPAAVSQATPYSAMGATSIAVPTSPAVAQFPAVSAASTFNANGLSAAASQAGNQQLLSLAGSYTMGATKLFGQYNTIARDANVATVQQKLTHMLVGITHTMGNLTLKASYNSASRADGTTLSTGTAGNTAGNTKGFEDGAKQTQLSTGFVYDFSKRTALYGTYAVTTVSTGGVTSYDNSSTPSLANAGAAAGLRAGLGISGPAIAAGSSSSAQGIDIGLRHRF